MTDPVVWLVLLGPTMALFGVVSYYDWRNR